MLSKGREFQGKALKSRRSNQTLGKKRQLAYDEHEARLSDPRGAAETLGDEEDVNMDSW